MTDKRQKRFGPNKFSAVAFCLFGTILCQVIASINAANSNEILKRSQRSPQRQRQLVQSQPNQYQQEQYGDISEDEELPYPSTNYGVPNQQRNAPIGTSGQGHQVSRQLMLHNQEASSGRGVGNLPLYKQSYPGLYNQGELKEFTYEPTHKVSHNYGHHGKEGHLFLFHPDTSHTFRGIAHSLHHDNLI